MYLARSSPTVLTWFMDASLSGLQRPHSGTPRPPGASTPSEPLVPPRSSPMVSPLQQRALPKAVALRSVGLGLAIVAGALAGTAAAQISQAPHLHTNEAYVEEVMRGTTLDVNDPMAVFAYVLDSLP